MHQNAPFGDFFYTTIADVVGFLRDHAQVGDLILS
jgi:hypothetical protein